jgi:Double-GTPase 2
MQIDRLCEKPICHPNDSGCDAGEVPPTGCTFYRKAQGQAATSPSSLPSKEDAFASVSWTGEALGAHDLARIAARGRVGTIAIVGASEAGKTSFLSTLYLQLLSGHGLPDYRFAGSFTFGGWEALAQPLRWADLDRPPRFPDHTPRGAARQPGLLHLALRDNEDQLCDVVFSDAPGEWFEAWAVNQEDKMAEGARWLERYADAVAVFLDSNKLSDPEQRGFTRNQVNQLLTRMNSSFTSRACAAVWAKFDMYQANPAIAAVQTMIDSSVVQEQFRTVSANTGKSVTGVMELANWLVTQALRRVAGPELSIPRHDSPFLGFRGRK